MNIVSNHNRLLRGAAIPTAGGDVYNSGWEYTPEGEISGYSGSAIYTGEECPCDSAAIVDSAFNKSTAWVDEQNYLTEHQDVTNLPYVQNSALEFSPQGLISGISGSGFYAASAEGALNAETANFAYNAEHADSADYVESAQVAEFATSSLSSNRSDVANYAFSADMVISGWEYDETSAITAYNGSAFKVEQAGDYSGIAPIVVDNVQRIISAESARLGVQDPLYFVEDSETATVIGIHDSAFSGRDWSDDITAASANALNEAINQITAVELANSALTAQTAINANHAASSDSATYDSLGRKIVDTYLTEHQPLPDWTPTIQNASGNAYNSAVNWVVDQHYLTGEVEYSAGDNIDITNHVVSGKDWSSEISDASANAVNEAINQITAVDYATSSNVANTALTANYVADGWEYNASNEITGYSGSAFHAETPSEGKIYTGISPIVVDNSTTTGTISAQTARLGVQGPLYFVEDTSASTVIGISGLPEVEGLMYESALNFGDGYITGYNSSALSSERSRYAVSSTSANGAVSSQTAAIVTGGWETANGKITGYNGTAFYTAAGNTYDVKASSNISVSTAGNTFTVSGKDWTNTITAASSYAYNQATAGGQGKTYDGVYPIAVNNTENKISAYTIPLYAGNYLSMSTASTGVTLNVTGMNKTNWDSAYNYLANTDVANPRVSSYDSYNNPNWWTGNNIFGVKINSASVFNSTGISIAEARVDGIELGKSGGNFWMLHLNFLFNKFIPINTATWNIVTTSFITTTGHFVAPIYSEIWTEWGAPFGAMMTTNAWASAIKLHKFEPWSSYTGAKVYVNYIIPWING